MTAGIFARVPAIAVFVTVALLATATLTLAATHQRAAHGGRAGDHARAGVPRRARCAPPGVRLRQGRARAGRLRLEGRRVDPGLLGERRRHADARSGLAGDRRRRAHRHALALPQLHLQAGGPARERVPLRRPPGTPRRLQGGGSEASQRAEARRKAGGQGPGKACRQAGRRQERIPRTQARLHRRGRAQGAVRRDRPDTPRQAALCLGGCAPHAHAERGQPLALPAQLDRHRRCVRLVRRSRGAQDADRGRPAHTRALGRRRTSESLARRTLVEVEASAR